jgi:lysyl-tRNA synthetase class 2
MELTDLERQRVEKLERLQAQEIEPYPHRVKRTHTIAEAIAALETAEAAEKEGPSVAVAGRLRSMRVMGKVAFAHIEDGSGSIQLFLRINELGEESYETFKRDFDLGDFVGAKGPVMRTRTGEISVRVEELRMLAKAISPLPVIKEQEVDGEQVRYTAFTDVEERYRQRYADLACNPDVREIFRVRARTLVALRRFF